MPRKKSYYAVYRGRKTGVFRSWEECSKYVIGFKGSVFKSFETSQEAETYLRLGTVQKIASLSETIKKNREEIQAKENALRALERAQASVREGQLSEESAFLLESTGLSDSTIGSSSSSSSRYASTGSSSTSSGGSSSASSSSRSSGQSVVLSESTYTIYTDGSCLDNRNVKNKTAPSGWGALVLSKDGTQVEELYGPVELDRNSRYYLRAHVGSNNTAELSAIGEALLWIRDFGRLYYGDARVRICYDSVYAANSVMGIFNGKENTSLYLYCRDILVDVKARGWVVEFVKVAAHSKDRYNDRADELAKVGCNLRCRSGRYAENEAGKRSAVDEDGDVHIVPSSKRKKLVVDLT